MPLPTLPPSGNTAWYPHYSAMDQAIRDLEAVGGNPGVHGTVLSAGGNIQAAIDGGARLIYLNPGTYNVSSANGIQIDAADKGLRIVGAGQLTRIVATASMPSLIGISGACDGIQLEGLVLDADGRATYGLDVNSNGTTGNYQGEPDAVHRFQNMWVYDALTSGVYARGTDTQATLFQNIRVRRAGTYGFQIAAPDNWIIGCEATQTSNTGAGFFAGGANCFYTHNKAWYCRGYGFDISCTRSTFTNNHSQDTRNHGWYVNFDKNTFSACIADSAAYYDVGGTVNGADGWFVVGDLPSTSITGCMGFDRIQGNPGGVPYQRYGINAPAAMFAPNASGQTRITGFVGYTNATALINQR